MVEFPASHSITVLVVVGLELDVAPLSEGSGIAEGVPGSDLVGECGPRRGGGVGIERICGAAGVVGQLDVEYQAAKFAPEEVDGRHSHVKLLVDTFVSAPMERPEKGDMALGVVNGCSSMASDRHRPSWTFPRSAAPVWSYV